MLELLDRDFAVGVSADIGGDVHGFAQIASASSGPVKSTSIGQMTNTIRGEPSAHTVREAVG